MRATPDDVHSTQPPETPGAIRGDSSHADVAVRRVRVRPVAIVVGVVVGLGPLVGLHVHAVTRERHDETYAHRVADAVGHRARTLAERLARVEQDLVACQGFVAALPDARTTFDAVADALLRRHATLTSVVWTTGVEADGACRVMRASPREPAAAPPDPAACVETRAALREAVRSGLPRLTPIHRTAAGPTARLVSPFATDPSLGVADAFVVGVRIDRWIGDVEDAARRALAVALLQPGDDGQLHVVHEEPLDAAANGSVVGPHEDRPLTAGGRVLVLRGFPTRAFEEANRPRAGLGVPLLVTLAWEAVAAALVLAGRSMRSQALAKQARTTRRIFRALVEGVVVAGPDHRVQFANEAATAHLGPPPPDGDARTWLAGARLTGPEGAPARVDPPEVLEQALHGATVPERDWKRPGEGADRWLALSARPLRGDGHRPDGAVVVVRDVSPRRRTRAALERLSRAIEQTADVVYVTDREGRILYANPAFERTTGWTSTDAIGHTPRILKSGVHTPEDYARLWRTILAGDVYRATVTNRRRDGSTFVMDQSVTPVKDDAGVVTHFVAVAHDATERVERARREAELAIVADVQRRLAPRTPPTLPGLEVAGAVFPAEATGGDAWDAVVRQDGRLLLAVADVCGHGTGPALLMAETRAYLRSLSTTDLPPHQIADQLEAFLLSDLPDGSFVSLLLAEVDPVTRAVRWMNAGHPPGLVVAADGTVRARLTLSGRLLGLDLGPDRATHEGPVLEDGDVLLLVTDGATDCPDRDGVPIDEEGLLALALPLCAGSPAALVQGLHAALREVSDGRCRRDDVTLVAVKAVAHPPAGPPSEGPSPLADAPTGSAEVHDCGPMRS